MECRFLLFELTLTYIGSLKDEEEVEVEEKGSFRLRK